MIDALALMLSHGMLVYVVLRLFKVDDSGNPRAEGPKKKPLPVRPAPRA